jgi:peptide/nickel transport system substrate-binding protein
MRRRDLLRASAAGIVGLAMPAVLRAEGERVLRFVPQSDLAVLDPVWTTADVTRNHGYLVFDTLYGVDRSYAPQPQMVEGHVVENDGKTWRLTLRDGLRFHDGETVRAADVVASIKRWGARDAYGLALLGATDALTAASDRVVEFRLKAPFPQLPNALAKPGSNMPCIMPERLAATDPFKPVTEMIGSGPYRFVAGERVSGSQVVYEKFAGYVPRGSGEPSYTAGPKLAHFDRILWTVIPDAMTAANAMVSGEVDWWEQPPVDLVALLAGDGKIEIRVDEATSAIGIIRFNFLFPPFDDPRIRRAILPAINQADFMTAVAGTDRRYWRDKVGVFNTVSPLATEAGTEVMAGDPSRAKAALAKTGYKGERVVALTPVDFPSINALGQVGAAMLQAIGMEVDLQALDWGTVVQRRTSKNPPDQHGWNIFFTYLQGPNEFNPAAHLGLRANGEKGWFGWPSDPKLEALRDAWFAAPDLATQQRLCAEIQAEAFQFVPFVPLGQYFQPTAYRRSLTGIREGFAQFYNVRPG